MGSSVLFTEIVLAICSVQSDQFFVLGAMLERRVLLQSKDVGRLSRLPPKEVSDRCDGFGLSTLGRQRMMGIRIRVRVRD